MVVINSAKFHACVSSSFRGVETHTQTEKNVLCSKDVTILSFNPN